ncbi:Gfo/Idh/MocA family oxidoreductase [Aminobacter sp. AP02]|uniref:Gfo/Idh/MocA family protein n=1 Tax=Aminobacter sp. AP02 TaxID=2135737 RepID=UPI000D6C07A6|nr:Gfo/Idh/MocA family oxidoreductase [Aminobacter sp. AP02]PWK60334.1 putative dehydrogenase [Aminobacter sp. AP02]
MAGKIRLGFIGANIRSNWASESHFPALAASSDVELAAVCTTSQASAEEAKHVLGARLAFSDYREMVQSDEIDAVVVVVRVPSHYATTKAAIEAGKHVYTEWPLGVTTVEAKELAEAAAARGLQTATGLQARVAPELMYMRELISDGSIGKVLSCHVSCFRPGLLARPASRTWTRDVTLGANPLTIQAGHILDTLRFVAGEFSELQAVVSTQSKQWYQTDTQQMVDVTSPDNVLINGALRNGAVASVHVATVPLAPSGYRMEIYGSKGSLVVAHPISSNHGNLVLRGTFGGNGLDTLAVPAGFAHVADDFPAGPPHAIGQMYALFAEGIRTGSTPERLPTFATAIELHHLLDCIRDASSQGRTIPSPFAG